MKESEKADKNVNAREIIANVLKELGMNAPSFSTATGIAYQRIFDLQRGRTKKFNPGVVNMICAAFPTISKTYLYTGEGPVMTSGKPQELDSSIGANIASQDEIAKMLNKVLDLSKQVTDKNNALDEKMQALIERERELMEKELELSKREMEITKREMELKQGENTLCFKKAQ